MVGPEAPQVIHYGQFGKHVPALKKRIGQSNGEVYMVVHPFFLGRLNKKIDKREFNKRMESVLSKPENTVFMLIEKGHVETFMNKLGKNLGKAGPFEPKATLILVPTPYGRPEPYSREWDEVMWVKATAELSHKSFGGLADAIKAIGVRKIKLGGEEAYFAKYAPQKWPPGLAAKYAKEAEQRDRSDVFKLDPIGGCVGHTEKSLAVHLPDIEMEYDKKLLFPATWTDPGGRSFDLRKMFGE